MFCSRFLILAALVLPAQRGFASRYLVKDLQLPACEALVRSKIRGALPSGLESVSVGSLSNLKELLAEAGATPEQVNGVMSVIERIKTSFTAGYHPILKRAVQGLAEASGIDREVFLCIAGSSCAFTNGAQGQSYFEGADRVAFAANPSAYQGPQARGKPKNVDEFGLRRDLMLIMLKVPEQRPSVEGNAQQNEMFARFIFHETTHSADIGLASDWVLANYRLIEAGEAPDPLFLKATREGSDGNLEFDLGFWKFFMESRAYGVESHVVNANRPDSTPAVSAERQAKYRSHTVKVIAGFENGSFWMKELGATAENIFELGEQLGDQMDFYIRRAAALPIKGS